MTSYEYNGFFDKINALKDITSEGWGIEIVCRGRSITAESLRYIEQDVKNLRMNVELYSIEYDKNKESIVLIFLDR